jgi:hypothetical protein
MRRTRYNLKRTFPTLFLLLILFLTSVGYSMAGSRAPRDSRGTVENEFFYYRVDHEDENGDYETLLIEGVFQEDSEGNLSVPWMWAFLEGEVEIIQLFDSGPDSKYFECNAYQAGETHRTIDLNAVGFLRGEHLPIPECIVVFSSLEIAPGVSTTSGWKWNGEFVGNETDGSGAGSGDCEDSALPGDERYVIPISDTEVLVVIIRNGHITVLIYRKSIDGCWRFDSAPADNNDPNLPGYTVGQTLPIVLTEYLMQIINGQHDEVPPFPYP